MTSALSEFEQRICREIRARQRDLTDQLARYVGIPTGTGHEEGLAEFRALLVERAAAMGAAIESVPGDRKPEWLLGADNSNIPVSVVCRKGDEPRVLIACHLDTVFEPRGPFCEMSIRPDGKTATGPGVVDMKGGIVIVFAALEALASCGGETPWTLVLTSDEETGSYHSESVLQREARAHRFGLVVEPALPGGELAIERGGSGQFMLEARGRSAHVGREFEKGVSAVVKLAEAIVACGRMPDISRGRIISVGPLMGGAATNAVPALARAWGNVRFPTGRIADELGVMLDALATEESAMPALSVFRSFNRAAKPMTPEVEALGLRARAVAETLGQQLPFARTGGVCDGNILQGEGLPTIDTLGARGGGLHTEQEWIELASLVERAQLFATLLGRVHADAADGARERAGERARGGV